MREHPFVVGDKVVIYATVKDQRAINRMCDAIFSDDDNLGIDITGVIRADLATEHKRQLLVDVKSEIELAYSKLSQIVGM
jgi:hypothetical protein